MRKFYVIHAPTVKAPEPETLLRRLKACEGCEVEETEDILEADYVLCPTAEGKSGRWRLLIEYGTTDGVDFVRYDKASYIKHNDGQV